MNILKTFLAGFLIAIGGFAFLKVGSIVGSFLFAFGIVCVVKLQTPLYTGIAGTNEKFNRKIEVLCGNICGAFLGAFIMLFIYDNTVMMNAETIVTAKINSPWYSTLSKSIMCGAIVDISVFISKRDDSVIPLLIGIPTFVMCGFNHSIADAFYFSMASVCIKHNFFKAILYYIIVVIGNYIGCNIRQIFTRN